MSSWPAIAWAGPGLSGDTDYFQETLGYVGQPQARVEPVRLICCSAADLYGAEIKSLLCHEGLEE